MNKSYKNTSGFAVVEILLVILTLAIIGGAGYLVAKHVDNKPKTQTSLATTTKPVLSTYSLNTAKIPTGWSVDVNDSSTINLTNKTTGCFVDLNKTLDSTIKESNSAVLIQQYDSQGITDIKQKAYSVVQKPASQITVMTNVGQQQLTTQELSIMGPDNLEQSYAYIIKNGYYILIQRSCNTATELATTNQALQAITVNE